MKKHLFLILVTCIPHLSATTLPFDAMLSNKNWYKAQAQQWVREYVLTASQKDLCLIANVLYFSWARSATNVATAHVVQDALQSIVDSAHRFDVTRLTPARTFTTKQPSKTSLDQLYKHLDRHEIISKTYHQALDLIIDKLALESDNAQAALKQVRTRARSAVAQGVASVVTHFDQLLSQAHTWLDSVIRTLFKNKPIDPTDSKAILQILYKYIERLLAKAFIASDSKYATAWNDTAQALLIPHDLHNALWDVMEQVRAAFYAAHYEALYEYTHMLPTPQACFVNINESGWITNATQKIPAPDSLLSPFALS